MLKHILSAICATWKVASVTDRFASIRIMTFHPYKRKLGRRHWLRQDKTGSVLTSSIGRRRKRVDWPLRWEPADMNVTGPYVALAELNLKDFLWSQGCFERDAGPGEARMGRGERCSTREMFPLHTVQESRPTF